jgi:hypothetical protein
MNWRFGHVETPWSWRSSVKGVLRDLIWAFILVLGLLLIFAFAPVKLPIIDVRFGQRTIAVADPNRSTLTLTPGAADIWICAPHEGGRACKQARDINAWLLANDTP